MNNKLKEIDIKNCTWYYFEDIVNLYEAPYSLTPFSIIFNATNCYIEDYNGNKYVALFLIKNIKECLVKLNMLLCYLITMSDVYFDKHMIKILIQMKIIQMMI